MILLPPSETKSSPVSGIQLDLSTLSFSDLTSQRKQLLKALVSLSKGPQARALKALQISESQMAELKRNVLVHTAPTEHAINVYKGVLFEALDHSTLSKPASRYLHKNIYISSALFGLLAAGDNIPAYRLSATSKLPGMKSLASVWNALVVSEFHKHNEFIVDLRSGSYQSLGKISPTLAERCATATILQVMPSGKPQVVSHFNKATKGRLVRLCCEGQVALTSASDLALVASRLTDDVQVIQPTKSGQPTVVEVVLPLNTARH